MSSVHEARYGDERLDIARAGRVGAAARAQVVHERLHRLAQALRTEDPTKAGRDVLLTLEPAEQAQGVGLVPSHCDGFDTDAVAVAVDRLNAPLGEGLELTLECGRHVDERVRGDARPLGPALLLAANATHAAALLMLQ